MFGLDKGRVVAPATGTIVSLKSGTRIRLTIQDKEGNLHHVFCRTTHLRLGSRVKRGRKVGNN